MIKKTLLISLVVLATNIGHAEEYSLPKSASAEFNITEIDKRIVEYTDYVTKIPARVNKIKEQLNKLTEMRNKNKKLITQYLILLENCTTNKLSKTSIEVCNYLGKDNFKTLLQVKENNLSNAINFLLKELRGVQRELSDRDTVIEGIKTLEECRKILLGS